MWNNGWIVIAGSRHGESAGRLRKRLADDDARVVLSARDERALEEVAAL